MIAVKVIKLFQIIGYIKQMPVSCIHFLCGYFNQASRTKSKIEARYKQHRFNHLLIRQLKSENKSPNNIEPLKQNQLLLNRSTQSKSLQNFITPQKTARPFTLAQQTLSAGRVGHIQRTLIRTWPIARPEKMFSLSLSGSLGL